MFFVSDSAKSNLSQEFQFIKLKHTSSQTFALYQGLINTFKQFQLRVSSQISLWSTLRKTSSFVLLASFPVAQNSQAFLASCFTIHLHLLNTFSQIKLRDLPLLSYPKASQLGKEYSLFPNAKLTRGCIGSNYRGEFSGSISLKSRVV